MRTIGIDVGGTKVLGVAVDVENPSVVVHEHRVPTPGGGDGLIEVIADLVAALADLGGSPAAVGVGVPGLVDADGVLRLGPHLPDVTDLPIEAELRARCGLPVAVENDANCHAVAEFHGGAAAQVRHALVVTLGTGIGAGVVVDGELLRGAYGFAGEPGHMVVDLHGPPCPCGRRGCWEQFASGHGLARLARSAALGGHLVAVVDAAGGDPELVRGEHVTTAARSGDRDALAVLDELADWIGLGLANLVNILDPELVVIGGGLVDAADLLLPRAEAHVHAQVLGGDRRPLVPVVAATLGERAGAIGAGLVAAALL